MSKLMADGLVNQIKGRVQQKIEEGEIDGDIAWWTLTVVSDLHDKQLEANDRLECVEKNPAILVGRFIKNNPIIAWAVAQVATLILVGTAIALGLGLLDKLGLVIVASP